MGIHIFLAVSFIALGFAVAWIAGNREEKQLDAEKEIPKKPGKIYMLDCCPNCGGFISQVDSPERCIGCDQLIAWEDDLE